MLRRKATVAASIYLTLALAGVAFGCLIPVIWHSKFYVDGYRLVHTDPNLEMLGSSFSSTSWLYQPIFAVARLLGADLDSYGLVFDSSWVIANLIFSSVYLGAFALIIKRYGLLLSPSGLYFLFVVVVLYSPYYGAVNKDLVPFVLTSFVVVFAIRRSLNAAVAANAVFLFAYGAFVREYFLLIAALALLGHFVGYRWRSLAAMYSLGLCGIYIFFSHIPMDLISAGRSEYLVDETSSRIRYFFDDTHAAGFILNRILAVARISFPLELGLLSPAYIAFVVFKCVASLLTIRVLLDSGSKTLKFCAHSVLVFTIVQGLFEPDFGSAFRHFMAMIPFLYVLMVANARSSALLPGQVRSRSRAPLHGLCEAGSTSQAGLAQCETLHNEPGY